jgi:hypothetical protein
MVTDRNMNIVVAQCARIRRIMLNLTDLIIVERPGRLGCCELSISQYDYQRRAHSAVKQNFLRVGTTEQRGPTSGFCSFHPFLESGYLLQP